MDNFPVGVEDFTFGYSAETYDAGCEWSELPNEPDYSPTFEWDELPDETAWTIQAGRYCRLPVCASLVAESEDGTVAALFAPLIT